MPFTFSQASIQELPEDERCILDLRESPVAKRNTLFRIAQQNALQYTYGTFVPGFATEAPTVNSMPYAQIVERPIVNAMSEGDLLYSVDFRVEANARAKVAGDIFEVVSSAILWNMAARWNKYMAGGVWSATPRYARPSLRPSPRRQVAVLNLPRDYDWVRLLVPSAESKIAAIRAELSTNGMGLPTSTPDLAVVALPRELQDDVEWRTELTNLTKPNQTRLAVARRHLEGRIEPGEILLAIAFKKSLRSDRLYQPLYEANIMQLLLEGRLGAPKVEFEVHTLDKSGTDAVNTYTAASLFGVAAGLPNVHKAIRELYVPPNAADLAKRLLAFLNERMALVAA